MSYGFTGFFVRPPVDQPPEMADGTVWRVIESPFAGSGVRLPGLLGKTPAPPDVKHLACRLGLAKTSDWIFITYHCWAGEVDFVYGFGSRGGQPFGPVEDWASAKTRTAYLQLMDEFGVSPEDALNFAPFRRGFWGDA